MKNKEIIFDYKEEIAKALELVNDVEVLTADEFQNKYEGCIKIKDRPVGTGGQSSIKNL